MKRLPLLLAALALVLFAAPANAGDEDGPSRFFDTYDKDGDGRVTPEEIGVDAEIFRLLDRDKDGAITREDLGGPADYRPRRPPPPQPGSRPGPEGREPGTLRGGPGGGRPGERGAQERPRLQEMDADGDGRITREEFKGPPETFDRLDTNSDGAIDRTECEQGQRRDRRGGGRGGNADGGGRMMEHLKQLDKDGDGRVSAEEYEGRMPFERLDRNGDGFLDAKDFEGRGRGVGGGPGRGPGAEGGARMREALKAMDTNGDGKVSKDEYTGPIPFERLDRNQDGVLDEGDATRGEGRGGDPGRGRGPGREQRARGLSEQALKRFDRDGNGTVSREEFPGSDERFDQLDANGDGALSAADRTEPPAAAPPRPDGEKPGSEKPGPDAVRGAIDRDDADGDRRVSRSEYRGPDHLFDAMDENDDGFLDAADIP